MKNIYCRICRCNMNEKYPDRVILSMGEGAACDDHFERKL